MELHLKEFDGTTFGMSVEGSSPAFRRMKKNVFTGKVTPHGWHHERTSRCVRAADVAAAMGPCGWLVSEGRYMETIRWGSDGAEHYIIYERELEITNSKYEITDIAHEKYPFLHRIRALRDIGPTVKAGDLGGFVEHANNLSFEPGDDAWIFGDAIAAGGSYVDTGSILQDQAIVCGHAVIQDHAVLSGCARVEDHASVVDALVGCRARVAGGGIVMGYTNRKRPILADSCVILGNVDGNVRITGSAIVLGDEKIRNDSLFTVVVSEKGRSVERDPSLDELRPLPPAEEKKKPRHREAVR